MNIGEAAKSSGVSAKMIRYYERIGLLPPARRTESNYRVYSERDLHTLRFIQRARRFGFSIRQIQDLLSLWNDRRRTARTVKRLAAAHVEDLEARVTELQGMIATLRHLESRCEGGDRPDCPILDELAGGGGGRACH
jgi:MerR family transcriptional regulator, copper efflux regulator